MSDDNNEDEAGIQVTDYLLRTSGEVIEAAVLMGNEDSELWMERALKLGYAASIILSVSYSIAPRAIHLPDEMLGRNDRLLDSLNEFAAVSERIWNQAIGKKIRSIYDKIDAHSN